MFSHIVRIPIVLLQIAAMYNIPTEHILLNRLYKIYQICFQCFFLYIPNILSIVYLKHVDNFEVGVFCCRYLTHIIKYEHLFFCFVFA